MLRLGKLGICPGFFWLVTAALFLDALEALPPVLFAALCHEMGHLASLCLFGVSVEGICLTAMGAEISADTRYLPYWKDILCTLSGPFVNLLLAFLLARESGNYLLAGASFLQGAFNLLPITGLDGGRALQLLFCWMFGPVVGDRIANAVGLACAGALVVVTGYLVICRGTGACLLLAAFGVLRNALHGWKGK